METNRVRQFCVLYEIQNLRKAAEVVGLSHGAFCKSLKVLQVELGEKLYQQEGRGLAITDFGHKFYAKAQVFLNHEREFLFEDKSIKKAQKIGTFEVFSTHLLGSVSSKYFKDDALDLYEMLPGQLEKNLAEGKIDIGITYEPIPTAGIEFIKIGKIEMGIFARSGHFQGHDVLDIPFVAPVSPLEGSPTGVHGLDGWPDDKFQRTVKFRVDMMESGMALVRSGACAIFLPKFIVRHHNRTVQSDFHLTERKLPQGMKAVSRNIYILKRKSRVEGGLERAIAKLIRAECLES